MTPTTPLQMFAAEVAEHQRVREVAHELRLKLAYIKGALSSHDARGGADASAVLSIIREAVRDL